MQLETGHYETLVTQQLWGQLTALETTVFATAEKKLGADDAAVFITRHLTPLPGFLWHEAGKIAVG